MTGTVLLPSLNRPHLVKRFFDAYRKTKAKAPGMVIVDHTDPRKEEYIALEYPDGWHLVLTSAITMGDKLRETWDQYKNLDWAMIVNDDHIPETEGWDEKVISTINGHNVVSTNDGWVAPRRICGAICFSGNVIRTLGWLFPPGLNHLYSDDTWAFIFAKAQCANILMDVMVKHDHAYKDPSQQDETFFKVNGEKGLINGEGQGGFWPEDKLVFQRWLKENAEKDAEKITALQPKQGLMIATPSHDGNCSMGYALGLSDMAIFMATQNIYFEMARVVGSSLIPHARNSLVDMFLKSRCQRLLFVDSDQGWNRESALQLFQSNRKIIAGITPHKRYPINLNFEPLPEHAHYFKSLSNKGPEEFNLYAKDRAGPSGEIEVNRAGTGFMMIDRSVFDIMADKVPEYCPFDDRPEATHKEFFKMGGVDGKFRGEDWWFTQLAKECDIPIFIHAGVIVSHQGSHNFIVGAI